MSEGKRKKKKLSMLVSESGYRYTIRATKTGKLKINKFDPYTRSHKEFVEKKIK